MGATYERWLIAKGNAFSPGALAVVKLVDLLRENQWIASPGSSDLAKLRFKSPRAQRAKATGGYAVHTVENTYGDNAAAKLEASTEAQPATLTKDWLDDPDREELRLVWPVEADEPLPLKVPLTMHPKGPASYALEIHRSAEYVYPSADTIEALPTVCNCGEDLSFEWDDEELVPAFLGSSGIFAECEDCSRTFDPSKVAASIANPFDKKKTDIRGGAAYRFALKIDCGTWFEPNASLAFHPDLVGLLEKHFGRDFYEVGAMY